jgi:endonuclease G
MRKLHPRNLALLLGALFFFQFVSAQDADIVKIKHTYFTSYFSKSEHIPIIVQYSLKPDMLNCSDPIKRSNRFAKDPKQPVITNLQKDYTRSGYDRGHNMSAADNACDATGMKECFYFSNMTPQPHFFNAGVWEKLENQERDEARQSAIVVFVGSLGKTETIGADKVYVPKYMWKVIYHPDTEKYECYLFPDSDNANKELSEYETTKDEIETHAGIQFTKDSFAWVNE